MARIRTWGWFDPPVPVTATDQEKLDANLISAAGFEINPSTLNHEIVRARMDFTDADIGKPTWCEFELFRQPGFISLKKQRFTLPGDEPITYAIFWAAHLPVGEIDQAATYWLYFRAEGYGNLVTQLPITEAGAEPPPEIDMVLSRTSVTPETFAMPSTVTFITPLLNNGNERVYFDFDIYVRKPDLSFLRVGGFENDNLAAHSTWDIETIVNFTDLPLGSHGIQVNINEPGIWNPYASRVDTDVFTVTVEEPPPEFDITIAVPIATPSTLTMPDEIGFVSPITNVTASSINYNYYYFMQNPNHTETLIKTESNSSISAGQTKNISWGKSFTNLEVGNYGARIVITDYSTGNLISEKLYYGIFSVTSDEPPAPEFTVTNLSASPTDVTMPVEITFKADIRNIGSTSVDFVVAWDLIAPGGQETSIGTSSDLTLPAGQMMYGEHTKNYTDLVTGIYDFRVSAIQLGTGLICDETTLTNAFTVGDPAPSFWEIFLNMLGLNNLIDILLGLTQTAFNTLNTIFNVMTGADFVESDADIIRNYLPGFVAWSVIEYGKQLNDEDRNIPTETEMLYILLLGTAIAAIPVVWQALGAKLAVGPAAGSAEAYLHKYFLTATAESAPVAGSLEAIILANSANAGVVSSPAAVSVLTKLAATFTGSAALAFMKKYAMYLIGGNAIALWLASDNIVTGTTFPMNRLKAMVEDGILTQEEALAEIAVIQSWKDYATQFINVSTIVNPLTWLFRSLFMKNTELAQLNIDQIRAQIEALEPTPAERGTLDISSTPAGARVYIDDEFKFEYTNTSFFLPIGTHILTLKMQGYIDHNQGITIIEDETITVSVNLQAIEPQMRLTVWSVPPNARIYIDEVFKYEYTNTTFSAPAGSHILTIKKEGYNDYSTNYDYPEGSQQAVEFDMAAGSGQITYPLDEVAFLLDPTIRKYNCWKVTISARNIYSGEELNAFVLIDDVYMPGTTPLEVFLAAQSTFNIKLHLSGYKEGELNFTTDPLP